MKKKRFNVGAFIILMAVVLVGVAMILPEKVKAATSEVSFKDGYSGKVTKDVYINNMVDWYKIKLPNGWKYTDEDVTIEVSDEKVAYIDYDSSNPDIIHICGNYDTPYKKFKLVTIKATKTDPESGEQKVAKLKVHRCMVYFSTEKKTIYAGSSFKVKYKVVADKDISEADFESYDTSIATVSADGTVKAKKAGEVRIAVSTIGGRAWMDITVKPLPTISKKTAILEVGDTVKLSMKHLPKGKSVVWKSSNQKVVRVNNGVVKAVAPGKVRVTATIKLDGKKRQSKCIVTVKKPTLSRTNATLALHTTMSINVKGSSGKVKWTTTDKKVATVKDGTITAVGIGSCSIKANVNGVTLICKVRVKSNEYNWKVVKRPGYYREAYDDYNISKVKYNKDKSITVEGYFINTHIYNISRFDYMYIEIRDAQGSLVAANKIPKFAFKCDSYKVKKLVLTIPKEKVRRIIDFEKDDFDCDYDYVFEYNY